VLCILDVAGDRGVTARRRRWPRRYCTPLRSIIVVLPSLLAPAAICRIKKWGYSMYNESLFFTVLNSVFFYKFFIIIYWGWFLRCRIDLGIEIIYIYVLWYFLLLWINKVYVYYSKHSVRNTQHTH
jgi:hypothetical protein